MWTQLIKKAALISLLGATLAATSATWADSETLTGAGSTAIYPVLSQWADTYHKSAGVSVNYQAIGSGGGIQQIQNKTVDFAASDKPLKPEDLAKQGLIQFPAVIIGIAPVVNLPGIKQGELVLSGPVLADIYLAKITKWNDPQIAALNPSVKLPDMAISVVHRSDGSGTTFTFTNYLSKVSPDWSSKVGFDTAVGWPTGVGGKGNAGVAGFVQQISGSIGYVEFAYALQNKMAYTRMTNSDGHTLTPSLKGFQAAAAGADFSKIGDFYLILTDQPGAESWPITGATWVLMRKDYAKAQNEPVVKFCKWFLMHGQSQAEQLDYGPLPPKTVKLIESYWKTNLGI